MVRHLLEIEAKHDIRTVRRVVHELLDGAAALGVPEAHKLLAELYVSGRLTRVGSIDSRQLAFEHHKIAARLWTAAGKTTPAATAEISAATLFAQLTIGEQRTAKAHIDSWKVRDIAALPPFISGVKPAKRNSDTVAKANTAPNENASTKEDTAKAKAAAKAKLEATLEAQAAANAVIQAKLSAVLKAAKDLQAVLDKKNPADAKTALD